MIPALLIAIPVFRSAQSAGHPFDATKIYASIDSFAFVTRVTGAQPAGYMVQTIARDNDNIRIAVDYDLGSTVQRVEMMMSGRTLAPIGHAEMVARRYGGDARGEVHFSDGRARGAYILSKGVIDIPLDSGIVDDDASTALLPTLPLDSAKSFTFRTFASPGRVEITRVLVAGIDTVTVPAGRFEAFRLTVMARDTSSVYVSTVVPRRVVLVRLSDGSGEMRLLSWR